MTKLLLLAHLQLQTNTNDFFDTINQPTDTEIYSAAIRHMANIHQDGNSIRNIQVVSSNRVHSTRLCEANKCWIFKPFFLFIR